VAWVRTFGTEPRGSRLPSTATRNAVQEAALRWRLVADLRLQLFDAGVSALKRLVHDQRRLHQGIGCMRARLMPSATKRSDRRTRSKRDGLEAPSRISFWEFQSNAWPPRPRIVGKSQAVQHVH
jgi:hypothetical protein